jgi:hypothetical protein
MTEVYIFKYSLKNIWIWRYLDIKDIRIFHLFGNILDLIYASPHGNLLQKNTKLLPQLEDIYGNHTQLVFKT